MQTNHYNMVSPDLELNDNDVVCGRGKGYYNREGNVRFRDIVRSYIPEYTSARTKYEKSRILENIMEVVQSQNNGTTRFVRLDEDGFWVEIAREEAREKVGHAMRELLASQRKKARQTERRKNQQPQQRPPHTQLAVPQQPMTKDSFQDEPPKTIQFQTSSTYPRSCSFTKVSHVPQFSDIPDLEAEEFDLFQPLPLNLDFGFSF